MLKPLRFPVQLLFGVSLTSLAILLISCDCDVQESYVDVEKGFFAEHKAISSFANEDGMIIALTANDVICSYEPYTEPTTYYCNSYSYQGCGQGFISVSGDPVLDFVISLKSGSIRAVFNEQYIDTAYSYYYNAQFQLADSVIMNGSTYYHVIELPLLNRSDNIPADTAYYQYGVGLLYIKKQDGGWWKRIS